jgi:hypothetical protein
VPQVIAAAPCKAGRPLPWSLVRSRAGRCSVAPDAIARWAAAPVRACQSRKNSVNRVELSAVYLVVCVMLAWPSQDWMLRVSTPSFASL